MIISGFFRCLCEKIHSVGGITLTSRCPKCNTRLFSVMCWRKGV